MDTAEAPVRGDLDQVWSLVAVRHHVVDILVKVQYVLAVSKVPVVLAVEGEVEEGLVEVKAVVAMTIATAAIRLGVIGLPVTVIIGTFVFIGQDLDLGWNRYQHGRHLPLMHMSLAFITAYINIPHDTKSYAPAAQYIDEVHFKR